ncbi:MAG: response regulator transcription factor [SAR324 cluster bacterium]|nr:response regulator transcription factor [SAR324 cluster bacterium]
MIVEDEEKIALLLKDYLKVLFNKISVVGNGKKALAMVAENPPSFMILDVMLPGIDGFEICKTIRKTNNFPILFLTARVSEMDRILGFEFGADDYVIKPFSPREVLARVNAIIRRFDKDDKINQLAPIICNGVNLDHNLFCVKVNGKEVKLTATEFSLLAIMMDKPDFVFERSFLVKKVMGYQYEGYERNIDAHIKNIRRKIAKVTDQEKIESIYGVGYKFCSVDYKLGD